MFGRDKSHFANHHFDSTKAFFDTDVIKILEFLIHNIFAMFGVRVFQVNIGIAMGTNSAPFLAHLPTLCV